MNVPSGVRSAVYIIAPIAYVIGVVPSTDPVIILCGLGLCIGAGILAWRNVGAPTELGIPTPTSSSSSSPGALEADSYTDVTDVAGTGPWTNYPSTPTTGTQPEGYEPESPADHSWLTTELIGGRKMSPGGYIPVKSRVSDIPSVVGASRYDTDRIKALEDWCKRVPPNPPVYEKGWKR